MFSALYYPHIELQTSNWDSQRLLKRALLMWDRLEFIVPDPDRESYYSDPLVAEAIELIGANHCPNDQEKAEAHERIEELVTRPNLPDVFYYTGSDVYEVYPQKFLPDTWRLLTEAKFAEAPSQGEDYRLNRQAGLVIMAILADCCAGTTRARVTDRTKAYASLTGILADNPEDDLRDRLVDATLVAGRKNESLISLRLSLLEVDSLRLNQLINFRRREETESGGHTLRDLRHRYLERIETEVKKLTSDPKLTKPDIEERERVFFQESMDDIARLNEEIRQEQRDAVLSKDILVTLIGVAVPVASALFPPLYNLQGVFTLTGAPVTLGGAVSTGNKYLRARADLLRKHPMAFVHELSNQ